MAKRKDPLNYSNPEWHKRQDRWLHNSFTGHCHMGQAQMNAIQASKTATPAAKTRASEIHDMLELLKNDLKDRLDG